MGPSLVAAAVVWGLVRHRVWLTLCFAGLAGLVLLAVGFETAARPSIYPLASFWTSSPDLFRDPGCVIMLALALIYGLERLAGFTLEPLQRLGRSSLFVYWIHVELVYGYTTWPSGTGSRWRRREAPTCSFAH